MAMTMTNEEPHVGTLGTNWSTASTAWRHRRQNPFMEVQQVSSWPESLFFMFQQQLLEVSICFAYMSLKIRYQKHLFPNAFVLLKLNQFPKFLIPRNGGCWHFGMLQFLTSQEEGWWGNGSSAGIRHWAAFFRLVCCLHEQNLFLLDSTEVVSFSPRNIYISLPPTWPESDDCVPGPLPDNLNPERGCFITTSRRPSPIYLTNLWPCSSWWSSVVMVFMYASPPKNATICPSKSQLPLSLAQSSPSRREALVVNQTSWIFPLKCECLQEKRTILPQQKSLCRHSSSSYCHWFLGDSASSKQMPGEN